MAKEKIGHDKVRKAYYELSDKIEMAKEELRKLDNPALTEKIKQLEVIRDEIYRELDDKYLWD